AEFLTSFLAGLLTCLLSGLTGLLTGIAELLASFLPGLLACLLTGITGLLSRGTVVGHHGIGREAAVVMVMVVSMAVVTVPSEGRRAQCERKDTQNRRKRSKAFHLCHLLDE